MSENNHFVSMESGLEGRNNAAGRPLNPAEVYASQWSPA